MSYLRLSSKRNISHMSLTMKPSNGATNYGSLQGCYNAACDYPYKTIMMANGILRNFRLILHAAAGGGCAYIATLVKNDVDTAVVLNSGAAATTVSDLTTVVPYVIGDYFCWKFTYTGAVATIQQNVSLIAESD